MATLTRDSLDLNYEVTGSGPALLLPKFNFLRWEDYLDVGLLAGRFTVVIASPRGFMTRASRSRATTRRTIRKSSSGRRRPSLTLSPGRR